MVIPVAAPHKAYAQEVAQKLWDAGLYADADMSDATLPKKIRNGEVSSYNFILGPFRSFIFFRLLRTSWLSQ
jgi:threonyl-tRNA synthetase